MNYQKFDSLDELLNCFRHFDIEAIQLKKGNCISSITQVILDDVWIQHSFVNFAVEHQGVVSKDHYAFAITDAIKRQIHSKVLLDENSLIITKPSKGYKAIAPDGHESITIHVPKEIIEKKFPSLATGVYSVKDINKLKNLESLCKKIFHSDLSDKSSVKQAKDLLIEKLELTILNLDEPRNAHRYYKHLENIIDFMKKNSNLSINDIATNYKISDRTIRNVFMHQVGISPKQYIKAIKMDQLKKELSNNSNSRITQALKKCKIHDHSLASKEFKEYFQMTPTQYKKLNTQNI